MPSQPIWPDDAQTHRHDSFKWLVYQPDKPRGIRLENLLYCIAR